MDNGSGIVKRQSNLQPPEKVINLIFPVKVVIPTKKMNSGGAMFVAVVAT